MTTGSIGSHRAFMGVSFTLCACLALALFIGWRFYFEELHRRNTLIEMAERDKARSMDLETMGLSMDAGKTPSISGPDATRMVLENHTPTPARAFASANGEALHPAISSIKELPLQETSEEVVQAVTLLDKYWATPAWKDRLRMVVDPERVAPLMENFYETQKSPEPVATGLISKARYQIDGMEILYFRYNGNRSSGTVEVAMRRGADASFLIDWESLVGYGEMSFDELRAQRPAKPVQMRVFARQFEYFNFEFSDASKYLCVKLSSPGGENAVYAYAERGTPLGDWLSSTLSTTGPTATVGLTVTVAFPPDAQSNQCVKLLRVAASRWLVMP